MADNLKLQVKDLTISFRTTQGMVRAVRGISFDLYEGETLAIVGESGSGKSVTSKAIMGILEGNAVINSGEIIYENQDLTEIDEENFHRIRGDKIGMIFQDPMSSLNPIMRIGKQITEGMLINGNHLLERSKRKYQAEKQNYINAKKYKKELKIKYKESKLELKNDKQSADFDKGLEELKSKYKQDLNDVHKNIQEKKSIYKQRKAEAKKEVKAEWQKTKSEYTKELEKLKEQYKNAKSKETKATKEEYNRKAQESFNKEKDRIQKRISELKERYKVSDNKTRILIKNEIRNTKEAFKQFKYEHKRKSFGSESQQLQNAIKQKREEMLRERKVTKRQAYERAVKVMSEVGIPEPEKRMRQYPFQFSGGMRQRIVIAIALTANPDLLICDEPTTALDVTIQSQILELIKALKNERSLSVIFITHDLGVVANMADRIAVMYAGKIVEIGSYKDIFYNPKHPYTWALLSSVPDLDSKERLISIPGTPPNMLFPPKGDAFAERNAYAMKVDFDHQPPYFKVDEGHYAATWLLHENAPKVELPDQLKKRINKAKKSSPKEREVI